MCISLLFGKKSFPASYSAKRIDAYSQELCNILQFYPVQQSGVVFKEFPVTLFRGQLESLDKQVAQQDVALLMNYPSPIGNVNIFLIKGIQLLDWHCVYQAICQGFDALDRRGVVVE